MGKKKAKRQDDAVAEQNEEYEARSDELTQQRLAGMEEQLPEDIIKLRTEFVRSRKAKSKAAEKFKANRDHLKAQMREADIKFLPYDDENGNRKVLCLEPDFVLREKTPEKAIEEEELAEA
ncbi:MAG TPA: hypothetical protein DCE55_29350 [Planctomycetaceae bacterium]|nr:hypothetical protein [Planctomycetaceae bacterium]|tara:strand:- start:6924 stop:7286 length:363 start_codon:yes stop_codon:yes gene_type:complete